MKSTLLAAASGLILAAAGVAFAQHGGHEHGSMGMESQGQDHESMMQGHAKSQMHGGMSSMTKAHHFEVVYLPDGIRLYPYDSDQKPITAEGIHGQVTLKFTDKEAKDTKLELTYMRPMASGDERMAVEAHGYLFAPADLSALKPGSFRAQISLADLPEKGESEVQFVDSFTGLTNRPYMCPMHPDVWGETAESECPLCGMKTTMKRPATGMMKEAMDAPQHGGDSH